MSFLKKNIGCRTFWTAGTLFAAAAFCRAYVRYQFDFIDGLLIFLGFVMVLSSLRGMGPRARLSGARVWFGLRTISRIMAVLSLLVLVNAAAVTHDHGWDVTAAKQHTLSKYTTAYIAHLPRKVRLTAFVVGLPPQYLVDMLDAYAKRSNGGITTEIIDPLVDLGYAAQFGNVISGTESKIFVQTDIGRKDIDFTDAPLSEEQLTNEIVRLTRPPRKAYFLAGHNEPDPENDDAGGLSSLAEMMARNHITSAVFILGGKKAVPSDCDILVIAGPKSPLSKDEEDAVRAYLREGGDALLMPENTYVSTPDQPLTKEQGDLYPSLNGILADWGMRVNKDIVVDLASHVGDDVGSPATRNYMPHKAFVKGLDYTFFLRPRSISLRPDRRKTVNLAPVILTASDKKSWGETDRYLEVKFDSGEDRPGPVPIAFVAFEPRVPGDASAKPSDTRLFVITDTDFITNQFINEYGNATLAMNIINWLSESDYQVFMAPKNIDTTRLDLTSKQKRMVMAILVFMPFVVLVQGIGVWIKSESR